MLKKLIITTLLSQLFLLVTITAYAEEKNGQNWEDEIIYSLMVDRFSDGDLDNDYNVDVQDPLRYQGGDIQGIIDQLDYIQDMNFTVIQLSSIFANEEGGFHGEWVKDYTELEPHFGTMKDFEELVDEVHKRKMKLILEMPVMSPEEYPNLEEVLLSAAKFWVSTGVDGLQMNHIGELSSSFWEFFISEMKKEKKDLFITGFEKEADQNRLDAYDEIGFDRMLNVPIHHLLRKTFAEPSQSPQLIFDSWTSNEEKIGRRISFLDHQYGPRFTRDMLEQGTYPITAWKQALAFLYTQPEVPMIFYATEIAVDGGELPDNIPLMNFRSEKELVDHISRLGEIRKEQPALTKGTLDVLYEKDGMVVYKRQYKSDTVVVAINNSLKDQAVRLTKDQLADEKELRGLLNSDLVRSDGGEYQLVIDRDQAEIYKMMEKSGYNIFFILSIFFVFALFGIFMYITWRRGKKKRME
ncbi:alpha-amylase family glycosyl hydrolase [Lederbergia sp. NSJ-179]|uniref:alpha-amylase family glycosyl hydrolase n=1 Tax=Lederbergia sp. NSJ-179 TaxID=2931402 RepID=UPI001FD36B0C|nr:alpha-amylase family glycosyl hydrolase [Lederbergia sp. NSJ-179]MCJ7840378.1 alpha-amylase family glycosyl hydrolase [Lederbergia sp. NSJ-179]